jgi:hypothetical protein
MEPRTLAPNVRAAVSTAVCTLLAVAAHRTMAGVGIPVAAVLIGGATVFCFARIAAALGERGLGTIGLLVGSSQIGLHLLFQEAQGRTHSEAPPPIADMAGMEHMANMAPMTQAADMAHMAATAHAPHMASAAHMANMPQTTPAMTIAHILAALAAAWWLRRGEAALFAAVARATRSVLDASWRLLAQWSTGTRPIRSAAPSLLAASPGIHKPAVARVLLFTVIRRGPPTRDWLLSS